MSKRPTVKYFRRAAERCVHVYDDKYPPLAKQTQQAQNTRSPNGMWIELWVWVPTEAAHMEKKE